MQPFSSVAGIKYRSVRKQRMMFRDGREKNEKENLFNKGGIINVSGNRVDNRMRQSG